jgi:hypothetical protein
VTHQEKRNRTLLVTLIALSAVTAVYFWFIHSDKAVVAVDTFRVEDLTTIDKVVLESKQHTVELTYDGVRWMANGTLADRNMVDVLFATLQQAQPLRPVAKILQDSIVQQVQQEGVKVSLFSEDNQELLFWAGGNLRKSQAYFVKEGEGAFIMTIPGYRVYVSGIFELENGGWKDKYVFQLNWRNFTGLSVQFPNQETDNYAIRFTDGFFSVEGLAATDTTKLNDFLDAISLLTVDDYLEHASLQDSLTAINPQWIVTAFDVASKQYTLALYWRDEIPGRVTGIINGSQLAYFDKNRLLPMLKKRNYFVRTE